MDQRNTLIQFMQHQSNPSISLLLSCSPSLKRSVNYGDSLLSTLPSQLVFPPILFFFFSDGILKKKQPKQTEIEPHHLKVF